MFYQQGDWDMQNPHNVFSGPNALLDLHNPDNHPPLPLVELDKALNPFRDAGVRIYAKLMYLLPLMNLKSLVALNMLIEAKASDKLEGVHTLVEGTSGNTGVAEVVLGRLMGIAQTRVLVPWDIAIGKLDMLRLFGAIPELIQDLPGDTAITKARAMGEQEGWLNLAQYENEANPAAHAKWTANQIWHQLGPKLTVFCAGLGTTGTFVGSSRFLKEVSGDSVACVAAVCQLDQAVPGVRSLERLKEIAFNWRERCDAVVEVDTKAAFRNSLKMCRVGILAGPSSGFAHESLVRFIGEQRDSGKLDKLRNKDGEVVAAFVCGDTPFPYLDKYSTILDPQDF